jgi:hypothetical protein
MVAALNGQASVDPSRLFPSDDKTQFGDWVKAGALKIGDQVSSRSSVTESGAGRPGPRLAANDNGVPASGLPLKGGADNQPLTVTEIIRDSRTARAYNFEVESRSGEITHNYFVGDDSAWVHNSDFGKLRRAYEEACKRIGGCKGLKKFVGKWGSPSRGNKECGIRLDPADDRRGPHINWWDWRLGKRGSGGASGHVEL